MSDSFEATIDFSKSASGGQASAPVDYVLDASSELLGQEILGVKISGSFQAYTVKDQIQIIYDGKTLKDSGMISNTYSLSCESDGDSPKVIFRVTSPLDGTAWNFSASVSFIIKKIPSYLCVNDCDKSDTYETESNSCKANYTPHKTNSVDWSSGEFVWSHEFMSTDAPGVGKWGFALDYASESLIDDLIGKNFNFPQHVHLEEVADTNIKLVSSQNSHEIFTTTDYINYTSEGNAAAILRRNGRGTENDELVLTAQNGNITKYNGFYETISGKGRIKSIEDKNGNNKTFEWTTTADVDQLLKIIDSYKREIIYSYYGADKNYLLKEIEDFKGRQLNFQYDGNSHLVAIITPSIHKAAEGNEFSNGTAYVFQYDTQNSYTERQDDLIRIWYPNETVAYVSADERSVDIEAVYANAIPRYTVEYGQNPFDEDHFGKVIRETVGDPRPGGTSGGTFEYSYSTDENDLPTNLVDSTADIVSRTTVKDRNGNETITDFISGHLIARKEEVITPADGETSAVSAITWFKYNEHGQELLVVYPEGNSVEYQYEDGTVTGISDTYPRRTGLLKKETQYPGNTIGIDVRSASADQDELTTRYFYDPLFNNLCATIDPRGNPINAAGDYFTPQNGGTAPTDSDCSRYATFNYMDYQQNALSTIINDSTLQSNLDLTSSEISSLISFVDQQMKDGGLPNGFELDLGDLNGDGTGDGASSGNSAAAMKGDEIKTVQPGESTETVQEFTTYNEIGQMTTHVDAAGTLTAYVRYPESDPEGDGKAIGAEGLTNKQYGLLKEVHVDINPKDVMTLIGADGDMDSFDYSGINRLGEGDYLDLVTRYTSVTGCSTCGSDSTGDAVRQTDPRGLTTVMERNEIGEVYKIISPAPYEFLTEVHYDANRNVVRQDVEDWVVDYDSDDPSNADYAHFTPSVDTNLYTANIPMKRGEGGKIRPGWFTNLYEYDLIDRKISQDIDATGSGDTSLVTLYGYDRNGNLTKITDPAGLVTEYHYDNRGLQIAQRIGGEGGIVTASIYDKEGYVTMQIGSNSRGGTGCDSTITIANAFGTLNTIEHIGAIYSESVYDGFGRLVQVIDTAGGVTEYSYNPMGQVIQMDVKGTIGGATPEDRAGGNNELLSRSITRYNDKGQEYETEQRVFIAENVILGSGRSVYHTGGGLSRLSESSSHLDQVELTNGEYSYVISSTEYDIAGRVIKTTSDNHGETTYAYDGAGRVIKKNDPDENMVENIYDANGNIIQTKHTEKCTIINFETEIQDEVFFSATMYDCLNRPVITANQGPDGNLNLDMTAEDNQAILSYIGYDSRDNQTVAIDPKGNTTIAVYDAASRMLETVVHMREDGDGNNGPSENTSFLPAAKDAIRTQYVYDAAGKLVRQIDDTGAVTSYNYDEYGRQTEMEFHDGTARVWNYDGGDLLSYSDESGNIFEFTYDVLGRKSEVDISLASGFNGTTYQSFQYDGMGRNTYTLDRDSNGDAVCTFTYDSLSRLLEEAQTFDSNTRYVTHSEFQSYSAIQLTYPDGRIVVTDRDTLYRPKAFREGNGSGMFIADFEYFGPDRIAEIALGNGLAATWMNNTRSASAVQADTSLPAWGDDETDRLGYDGSGRMICKRYVSSELDVDSYEFTQAKAGFTTFYDSTGNKLYERHLHAENNSHLYNSLDSIGRLREYNRGTLNEGGTGISNPITLAGTKRMYSWNLDSVGNWTTTTSVDTSDVSTTENRTHNKLHQVLAIVDDSYSYDDSGNLTESPEFEFTWDGFNRMVEADSKSANLTVNFRYDALGRRIHKSVNEDSVITNRDYLYDGQQCIEERKDFDDLPNVPIKQYVWGLYIDELMQLKTFHYVNEDSGTTLDETSIYYPLQDLLYRTNMLTDSSGNIVEKYDTDAYGNTLMWNAANPPWTTEDTPTSNPACEFIFTGRRYDPETSLYYYRARYYAPQLGQFISRDPLGYIGNINLYVYVRNNPIIFTDWSGNVEVEINSTINYQKFNEGQNIPGDTTFFGRTHDAELNGKTCKCKSIKQKGGCYTVQSEKITLEVSNIVTLNKEAHKEFKYFDVKTGRPSRIRTKTKIKVDGVEKKIPRYCLNSIGLTKIHEKQHVNDQIDQIKKAVSKINYSQSKVTEKQLKNAIRQCEKTICNQVGSKFRLGIKAYNSTPAKNELRARRAAAEYAVEAYKRYLEEQKGKN